MSREYIPESDVSEDIAWSLRRIGEALERIAAALEEDEPADPVPVAVGPSDGGYLIPPSVARSMGLIP